MLQELLQSPATPVITFLVGLLLGHWFAIHRDKRKEHNELVSPLRKKVLAETRGPSPGRMAITRDDADALGARLNRLSRLNFMEACERYWQAKEQYNFDEIGQAIHPNDDEIRDAAKRFMKYVSIR